MAVLYEFMNEDRNFGRRTGSLLESKTDQELVQEFRLFFQSFFPYFPLQQNFSKKKNSFFEACYKKKKKKNEVKKSIYITSYSVPYAGPQRGNFSGGTKVDIGPPNLIGSPQALSGPPSLIGAHATNLFFVQWV